MQEASVPEAAVQVQGARQGQLLSEVRGQQGGGEKEQEVVWEEKSLVFNGLLDCYRFERRKG